MFIDLNIKMYEILWNLIKYWFVLKDLIKLNPFVLKKSVKLEKMIFFEKKHAKICQQKFKKDKTVQSSVWNKFYGIKFKPVGIF